ncbi:MAG: type 2 isopentenyl-diphosphate Delta-isomerase [Gammaproteobacteria bacterium]|nr:MAG: type 2 isopentenyl-diphosphate Delta-isomerase [Pseudomonadota bacterium]PIE38854.1 MAG: type 2 isopentenyl-diphosphate Delta-isomerase [Gammaproteobacteria bacterium]
MADQTNDRKLEHIVAIKNDPATDRQGNHFDAIKLTHRALPEISLDEVDTRCEFLGHTLSFPMLISSMTGGDHKLVKDINARLAQAAQQTGVAMAVGSQRVMFSNPESRSSFELRHLAPDVPLIGNLGAVQLNYGLGVEAARQAVDVLQADALYLHANPLQEAIQPEGDTNFSSLEEKIQCLTSSLDVPVFLKEIGCGLSPQDIELGLRAGVRVFDVAGAGGTSWSRIEHHRRHDGSDIGLHFQDWGLTTPQALDMAAPYLERATIIASGGLRNGIDMVKSVILGASVCGLANPLLRPAMHSTEAVVAEIESIKAVFRTAMFLLGVSNVSELRNNRALIISTP